MTGRLSVRSGRKDEELEAPSRVRGKALVIRRNHLYSKDCYGWAASSLILLQSTPGHNRRARTSCEWLNLCALFRHRGGSGCHLL